jgi:hypothetical protein
LELVDQGVDLVVDPLFEKGPVGLRALFDLLADFLPYLSLVLLELLDWEGISFGVVEVDHPQLLKTNAVLPVRHEYWAEVFVQEKQVLFELVWDLLAFVLLDLCVPVLEDLPGVELAEESEWTYALELVALSHPCFERHDGLGYLVFEHEHTFTTQSVIHARLLPWIARLWKSSVSPFSGDQGDQVIRMFLIPGVLDQVDKVKGSFVFARLDSHLAGFSVQLDRVVANLQNEFIKLGLGVSWFLYGVGREAGQVENWLQLLFLDQLGYFGVLLPAHTLAGHAFVFALKVSYDLRHVLVEDSLGLVRHQVWERELINWSKVIGRLRNLDLEFGHLDRLDAWLMTLFWLSARPFQNAGVLFDLTHKLAEQLRSFWTKWLFEVVYLLLHEVLECIVLAKDGILVVVGEFAH